MTSPQDVFDPNRSAALLREVSAAAVDASSIIYMLKVGMLDRLSFVVDLVTPAEVAAETGWPRLPLRTVPGASLRAGEALNGARPDDLLLALAGERGIALVSEDRELLMRAEERGIPYFNSLMMLILLADRGRCAMEEYLVFRRRLEDIGHYSAWVRSFADKVAVALRLPPNGEARNGET
jgi:hypothetical protein